MKCYIIETRYYAHGPHPKIVRDDDGAAITFASVEAAIAWREEHMPIPNPYHLDHNEVSTPDYSYAAEIEVVGMLREIATRPHVDFKDGLDITDVDLDHPDYAADLDERDDDGRGGIFWYGEAQTRDGRAVRVTWLFPAQEEIDLLRGSDDGDYGNWDDPANIHALELIDG